ncbi:hypothetical protein AB4582_19925 [Vibrio splendidus]
MLLIVNVLLFIFYFTQIKKSLFISLPTYYHFVCVYTILGTKYADFAKDVPFSFYDFLYPESIDLMVYFFILASLSFYLGIIITKNYRTRSLGLDFSSIRNVFFKIRNIHIILIYLLVVLFLHVGHGFSHIYYRQGYLIGDGGNSYFRIMYTMMLPFSMMILPFLKGKNLRVVLLFIVFTLVFGTSSRNVIVIPVFYSFGMLVRDNKISKISILLTTLSVIVFSSTSIQYRFNEFQGMIPNVVYFFSNGIDFKFVALSINYLTSFSFFASALTLQDFTIDYAAFYTSINPLPSSMLNVEHMISNQKLNQNAPFTAIGILSQGGIITLVLYFFITGYCWSKFAGNLIRKSKIIAPFVYVIFFLFTLLSIQYNLRSVTRYVYYMLVLAVMFSSFKAVFYSVRKND